MLIVYLFGFFFEKNKPFFVFPCRLIRCDDCFVCSQGFNLHEDLENRSKIIHTLFSYFFFLSIHILFLCSVDSEGFLTSFWCNRQAILMLSFKDQNCREKNIRGLWKMCMHANTHEKKNVFLVRNFRIFICLYKLQLL